MRHIFHWNDLGYDTLVTMSTRHLVTRLYAALDSDIYLHHLLDTGRQFIALGQFTLLLFELVIKFDACLFQTFLQLLKLTRGILVSKTDIEPVIAANIVKILGSNSLTLL